ncbi:unnamed protein product [Vitrella brassicaformis CCMP3155]|uniref:Apple domain-containing protein n=1 Tax=Vitrella brassicaformis (strain CCMP3155) TaxID=1169540 RepID=A0A0G4EYY7_VITBC|nr:unnamed protein product [Vitrella brassicaformis CCMP3155]|eukprot:CEM04176.1 unnamed protein product [Vitrella brassicaformis CCMP3155]
MIRVSCARVQPDDGNGDGTGDDKDYDLDLDVLDTIYDDVKDVIDGVDTIDIYDDVKDVVDQVDDASKDVIDGVVVAITKVLDEILIGGPVADVTDKVGDAIKIGDKFYSGVKNIITGVELGVTGIFKDIIEKIGGSIDKVVKIGNGVEVVADKLKDISLLPDYDFDKVRDSLEDLFDKVDIDEYKFYLYNLTDLDKIRDLVDYDKAIEDLGDIISLIDLGIIKDVDVIRSLDIIKEIIPDLYEKGLLPGLDLTDPLKGLYDIDLDILKDIDLLSLDLDYLKGLLTRLYEKGLLLDLGDLDKLFSEDEGRRLLEADVDILSKIVPDFTALDRLRFGFDDIILNFPGFKQESETQACLVDDDAAKEKESFFGEGEITEYECLFACSLDLSCQAVNFGYTDEDGKAEAQCKLISKAIKGTTSVRCFSLEDAEDEDATADKELKEVGVGACRRKDGSIPEAEEELTVAEQGACQHACVSSGSCNGFEFAKKGENNCKLFDEDNKPATSSTQSCSVKLFSRS